HYLESLRVLRLKLGDGHPTTIYSIILIGNFYRQMRGHSTAKVFLERALEESGRHLGANHFVTATSHRMLSMVLRELGDLEASRGHIEKSLQIFRTLFTDESHQVGTTLCSLADTEAQLGGTSADSLYRTGIEKLQRFFKASHPEVVDCQIRYADFLAIQTR